MECERDLIYDPYKQECVEDGTYNCFTVYDDVCKNLPEGIYPLRNVLKYGTSHKLFQ